MGDEAEAERLIVFVRLQLQSPSATGRSWAFVLDWVLSGGNPQTANDNRLGRGEGGGREGRKKRRE